MTDFLLWYCILCYRAEEVNGCNGRGGWRTFKSIWSKEDAACHKPQRSRRKNHVEIIHLASSLDRFRKDGRE